MIKIICLGKLKEKYIVDLVEDYKKRINKYHKLEIIELKDTNDLNEERKNIEKYLRQDDYIIALNIDGKQYDSLAFSNLIDKTFTYHNSIVFIIGSSEGLHSDLKQKADLLLSFSKMTFPHGLFRGILLEQIYRSFKIINNESYHK